MTAILNNGAVLAILTCGLTVVLVVGEFDLSVGAAASFGGSLGAVLDAQANWHLGLVILVVLACGILIGLFKRASRHQVSDSRVDRHDRFVQPAHRLLALDH